MMTKKSLVSIIIPTFNRAHLIGETLDSIIAQTYQNWECIVVDDGSTDNTEDIIQNYIEKDSRFSFYRRDASRKKGPSSCRNIGFEKSSGVFINFMDSDDLYKPNAFEIWIQNFESDTDAVVSRVEMIDLETGKKIKENQIHSTNIIEDHFVGNICYYVNGPMWRRRFLKEQDYLFDEELRNGDDWDFNLRMLLKQPILKFWNAPLISITVHQNSLSKKRLKLNKEELQSYLSAFEKNIQKLRRNKDLDIKRLENYVLEKQSQFVRLSLDKRDKNSFHFFFSLLKKEVEWGYYHIAIKNIFGFFCFYLFRKGYRYLKI